MGKDTKPLWQQMGRKTPDKEEEAQPSRWGKWFNERIVGNKTAAEVATEEAEKLKKKKEEL